MPEKVPLDSMKQEALDLRELAEAMRAVGLFAETVGPFLNDRERLTWSREAATFSGCSWQRKWWDGEADSPYLSFVLRDEVRKVAPGAYCIPTLGSDPYPLVVILLSASGSVLQAPARFGGHIETECWARAFAALHKAGLIGGGA